MIAAPGCCVTAMCVYGLYPVLLKVHMLYKQDSRIGSWEREMVWCLVPAWLGKARAGGVRLPRQLFVRQPWIEDVAQAIAKQVEGQHGIGDGQARKDRDEGTRLHMVPCQIEVRPPIGRRRW